MASTTKRVPSVLTSRRSAPPRQSRGMATRWTTASTPSRAGGQGLGQGDVAVADGDARALLVGQDGEQALGALGVAHEPDDAVAVGEQAEHDVAPDEAVRAGDQDGRHSVGILVDRRVDHDRRPVHFPFGRGGSVGCASPAGPRNCSIGT